jgi:hypothetical protein
MTYDIRPLSFSEILDRAFRVYLDNFKVLFGITAIALPCHILLQALRNPASTTAVLLRFGLSILVLPVMSCAVTIGVADVYLDRPVTVGTAYRDLGTIIAPVTGTTFLRMLVIGIPTGAFGSPATGIQVHIVTLIPLPLRYLAIFLLMMVVIYFAVCWTLLEPVMVAERIFGIAAFRRSRSLVVGSWWRTFGILFAALLIAQAPLAGLRLLFQYIPVAGPILTGFTYALSSTYGTVAWVIYYFDRRCRLEDFDLRLLAEQVRAAGQPAIETASEASAPV